MYFLIGKNILYTYKVYNMYLSVLKYFENCYVLQFAKKGHFSPFNPQCQNVFQSKWLF